MSSADQVIDELAANAKPDDLPRVDRQFADKLARLEADGGGPAEMVDRLRVMWQMLKAPDDVVPWGSKAQIMAAMTYFASPIDLVPDILGKLGYVDDAVVVRVVWQRIQPAVERFQR